MKEQGYVTAVAVWMNRDVILICDNPQMMKQDNTEYTDAILTY